MITGVDAYPTSSTVEVSDDVTLTCETRSPLNTPSGYSWHRVNGDVPSHASGQKTDTLTIHRIVPIDEGEYYCMAIWFGHCARSDSVTVIVKSKKMISYVINKAVVPLKGNVALAHIFS